MIPWKKLDLELAGVFSNGASALDYARERTVDLVIADIRMPVCDGLEMTRRFSHFTRVPEIILVSGHDSFEYAQQAIRFGVSDYVLKPVEPEELLEAVNSALYRIRTRKTRSEKEKDMARTIRKLSNDDWLPLPESGMDYRIAKALDLIKLSPHGFPTLEDLAEQVYLSPQHFSVLFKKQVGSSFRSYLASIRLVRARELLSNQSLSVKEVSLLCGFSDPDYFCRFFKSRTGMTPSDYREENCGKN